MTDADVLLVRVADRRREQARSEARTTAAMLEFADARRAGYEALGPSPHRELELSSIAHELAVEIQMSVNTVQSRLHQSREVRGRTPSAWLAFLDGRIDAYRVQIISGALGLLRKPTSDVVVEQKVVAYAESHTAWELRTWLNRLVARLEPASSTSPSTSATASASSPPAPVLPPSATRTTASHGRTVPRTARTPGHCAEDTTA